jgi:hypothetical protein
LHVEFVPIWLFQQGRTVDTVPKAHLVIQNPQRTAEGANFVTIKTHLAWIRIVGQNYRIIESDVCAFLIRDND